MSWVGTSTERRRGRVGVLGSLGRPSARQHERQRPRRYTSARKRSRFDITVGRSDDGPADASAPAPLHPLARRERSCPALKAAASEPILVNRLAAPIACVRGTRARSTAPASSPGSTSGGESAITRAAHPARSRSSSRGDDLADEPDLVGPFGRHALVGAEQRQSHDLVEGHLRQHLDRLEGGRHPVGDVRVEEDGVVAGDDELDLAEHVEGAAARHPLHGRDHRLPEVAALRADVAPWVVVHPRASGSRGSRRPPSPRCSRRRPLRLGRCRCRTTHPPR